ncbi:MAG TPA: hypothetical protein VIU12_23005 [Chryseolinea sp.]
MTFKPLNLLLVLLPLFITLQTQAQKKFTVTLKPEPIALTNRLFYIDSIVDARAVKANIGMAQVGMNNRQVDASFDKSFDAALLTYFRQVIPKQANQQRIIAVVNELRIGERTYKMKERGTADVEITFCRLDSGKLRAVGTYSDMQESGGMDVTAAHPKRLATALNICITKFHTSDWPNNPGTLYAADAEWNSTDNAHNIVRSMVRNAGIYEKFTQLRSNSPVSQNAIPVIQRLEGDLFSVRDKATDKKLREPFGVSDGTFVFINTYFYNVNSGKGVFARVIEEGRYMAWFDHYMTATEKGLWAGGFGAVGSAAASSDLDLIVLDLKTGVISPVKLYTVDELFKDDPELLANFQQDRNKRDPAVMLSYVKMYNASHPF